MFNTDVIIVEELSASSHAPYMTIAVAVCNRRNLITIAKPLKERHLNVSTEPATTVVKDNDVMNAMKAVESLHLSPEAMAALDALLAVIKRVCCVYTEHCRNLHETHMLRRSKDLGESFDL